MSDAVINDDFTALAELLDQCDSSVAPDIESLQRANDAVLERVRAEVAARSDGLRRAIVYYERLAEDAKRVMKQSEARAALIREYVKGEMQAAGIKSIKTATGSLTVRGNGGLEPLVLNADELPDEYTKVTITMPHALWSNICAAFAEFSDRDLRTEPGVTMRTEPDNARIREALAKPCEDCEGRGHPRDPVFEEHISPDTCSTCGGSGRFTIPGAHLDSRGMSLVVK